MIDHFIEEAVKVAGVCPVAAESGSDFLGMITLSDDPEQCFFIKGSGSDKRSTEEKSMEEPEIGHHTKGLAWVALIANFPLA
jgi:hypothetical protein